jgi:hypothetical protein
LRKELGDRAFSGFAELCGIERLDADSAGPGRDWHVKLKRLGRTLLPIFTAYRRQNKWEQGCRPRRLRSSVKYRPGAVTMKLNRSAPYSIAVFPFLKTSAPLTLGGFGFRCTSDLSDLTEEEQGDVRAVTEMLYVRDDYRIERATYCLVRGTHLLEPSTQVLRALRDVQAVVAYAYTDPRHEFGNLFLSSDHASLVVFSPATVFPAQVAQEHNVMPASAHLDRRADDALAEMPGFLALYNFKHHFCVAQRSRVYGPKPTMVLNISQDFAQNLTRVANHRPDYRLLQLQLNRRDSGAHTRIMIAIECFNAANDDGNEEAAAIVYLAVAFETLLQVPADHKTERIVDAISMLLGRIPRLDAWTRQFYDARSKILHEGTAPELAFIPPTGQTRGAPTYQSLLSYGRQIFQLSLATILVGLDLAREANLAEKLVTNQERFEKICKALSADGQSPEDALQRIAPTIYAASSYRYIREPQLKLEALLGAARGCAKRLLDGAFRTSPELRCALDALATATKADDHMAELAALKGINDCLPKDRSSLSPAELAAFELLDLVWGYVFRHYYWKERERRV